jgi:hypothetical protein
MIESMVTFLATCRERSISMLSLPTPYWHEIVAHLEAERVPLPPSLRLVVIAGERALPERLAAWLRHAPERPRLVNTYGLTESTVISTVADLSALAKRATLASARGFREVPIGRAVADTEIHVLDRSLAPVPLGMPGEIYIGGGLLARGYFDRPAVTAERFVPHLFTADPGARLYRTGDLGRVLPGGDLEFLGRADHQVKIRGYRIELGEIEAALVEHPAVAAAVVVVREDRPGQKRLVGYTAMAPGASGVPGHPPAHPAEAEELRAFLRRRLPGYMLPGTFVSLAELPLTPNGKLDRTALPPPEGRPDLGVEYAVPTDEMERSVAAIWQEVLGVERVGLHDNFFDLGGHSLLLLQIHDRLRERFGLGAEAAGGAGSLPIVDLFKYPSVSALAGHLTAALSGLAPKPPDSGPPSAAKAKERAAQGRTAVRQERFLKARRKLHE